MVKEIISKKATENLEGYGSVFENAKLFKHVVIDILFKKQSA
jgi:hypothetical protein